MTIKYPVESGVPIPPVRKKESQYPWAELKVGDSFFIPGINANQASSAATRRRHRFGGRYRCRTMVVGGQKGVRVWRIE
ncbi:hypothetical protein [Rhodoligotrophos defluvii]|uniref:hypothetical protein n=1 Tax=Rhodoligotrophos defluvii TaxID=2561934 RepID=UPI0010C97D39|nr:hypothetical protein [Rhodoligotrophos defluvii]